MATKNVKDKPIAIYIKRAQNYLKLNEHLL